MSGVLTNWDLLSVYAGHLRELIKQGINHPQHYDQPLTGLKIAVDAGNGSGGYFATQVRSKGTVGYMLLEVVGTGQGRGLWAALVMLPRFAAKQNDGSHASQHAG